MVYFGPFMSENQFNMVVQNNPPRHGFRTKEKIAMLIGYGRVSTEDQNLNLQLDALKKYGVEEPQIYQEHVSAAKAKRPELVSCLRSLREGDVLGPVDNYLSQTIMQAMQIMDMKAWAVLS